MRGSEYYSSVGGYEVDGVVLSFYYYCFVLVVGVRANKCAKSEYEYCCGEDFGCVFHVSLCPQ